MVKGRGSGKLAPKPSERAAISDDDDGLSDLISAYEGIFHTMILIQTAQLKKKFNEKRQGEPDYEANLTATLDKVSGLLYLRFCSICRN